VWRNFADVLGAFVRSLRSNSAGNVAILFALASPVLMMAVGGGIELARTYNAGQKLTEVADLACQYASRPSIIQYASSSNGGSTYVSKVTSFITASLQSQNFPYTQTNGSPFSYTANGPANVTLTSTVPTIFAGIVHVSTIPITASSHCYDSPSNIQQTVPNGNSTIIAQEGFEAVHGPCDHTCWNLPGGTTINYCRGCSIPLVQTQPANTSYVGDHGLNWIVLGYCLEQDLAGQSVSTAAQGDWEVELDCDNGSATAGNSSISTSIYLPAGAYELRYNYQSREDYIDYTPTYICGTTANDLNWANSTQLTSSANVHNALRTNQINVYLDANTDGTIPLHTTMDGTEKLGGSNLIDMCVYAQNYWIQRSVRINITSAGNYWLSFAADGANDSYGGQLDNIMLCNGTCSGSVSDNFPTAWASGTTLFQDTFESPSYVSGANGAPYYNTNGNTGNSLGTSGSSSGWPETSSSGWANAATNQLPYWLEGCPQGTQCIELGWGSNSLIGRGFLLVPGYYQVSYRYVSEVTFSNLSGVYCGATPSAARISTLSSTNGTGINRVMGVNHGTLTEDTNTVGVFMSHAQLASTPNASTTLGTTITYTNPDGSTSTTPEDAPNAISLTNYDASQNNPLLDICGYASTAQTRTVNILIQKTAYYWLTFAALGTDDSFGGQIDDVELTSLGSLYGTAPSGTVVTIPVPSPAPGSTYTDSGVFSGFSIIADPLTVPAP